MTLLPLAVALPLLVAALIAALRSLAPRRPLDALAILGAAGTVAVDLALALQAGRAPAPVVWFGGWHPIGGFPPGIDFVADLPSTAIATLAAVLATASLIFAAIYFTETSVLFSTLVLVFLAAANGYCLSGDLFTLFVFFELMGTAAYALTGHKIEAKSLEGAIGFAVLNSLGAFLLLWGIALLYARLGGLNLAWLGRHLAASGAGPAYVGTAFALIAAGFFVKAAIVPFHFWHADADAVAPTPVCVLISGVMAELGLFGLAKVAIPVFQPDLGAAELERLGHHLLWPIGIATAVVGALMCVRQHHIKRLLAFSTISHVGLMLCGLAALDADGLGGGCLYLIAHGLIKSALFLATGVVLANLGSVDEIALYGRGRAMPVTAIVFLLGALGLVGVPPFGTFIGKSLVERAGLTGIVPVFALVEALTASAVLRVAARVFLGLGDRPESEAEDSPSSPETSEAEGGGRSRGYAMNAVAGVLLFGALAMSAWPGLRGTALGAAQLFLDDNAYAGAVLGGAALGPPAAIAPPGLAESLHLALGTLAAAVVLALVPLYAGRTTSFLRALWRRGPDRLLLGLERIHSGHLGDYTAWLAAGFGALAATLTVMLRAARLG